MPLTSIRLYNFKCFEDSGPIPLAPLTLLFGKNNSGKSSILQSLLLLRQTLDSPQGEPRLNLSGSLYPAGSYADIVHQHRAAKSLRLTFQLGPPPRGWPTWLTMEFSSDEPRPPRLVRLRLAGTRGIAELEVRRVRGRGGPYELFIGSKRIGGPQEANFDFKVNDLLPLIGREPRGVGRPNHQRELARSFASAVLEYFRRTLLNLRSAAAFRRQPERRYEYMGRAPEIVDSTGAYAVHALIEDATKRGKRGELIRLVNRWLKTVGKVRLLPLRRISKSARLFEVRLKDTDSGRWANFADVGFGIGQALPVLVAGLRTPPGGLFLVQEPEIHLHPDAQLAMADFLIDLAKSGRQVIVETHSEPLLLRVRRKILDVGLNGRARSQFDRASVSVVYVDKDKHGASHAHSLTIDELGQIKNWPAEFMEEATDERISIMERLATEAET